MAKPEIREENSVKRVVVARRVATFPESFAHSRPAQVYIVDVDDRRVRLEKAGPTDPWPINIPHEHVEAIIQLLTDTVETYRILKREGEK